LYIVIGKEFDYTKKPSFAYVFCDYSVPLFEKEGVGEILLVL